RQHVAGAIEVRRSDTPDIVRGATPYSCRMRAKIVDPPLFRSISLYASAIGQVGPRLGVAKALPWPGKPLRDHPGPGLEPRSSVRQLAPELAPKCGDFQQSFFVFVN